MPRAIAATSTAKDSNVRGAPEDADDNPDAADGAGADGRDREAEVDDDCMDVDGGPDISDTRLLWTSLGLGGLSREERWRSYSTCGATIQGR
jgi:hypothetical protein